MGLINTSEIALFNFDDPRLGGGAENTTPLLFISTNFQFFCSLVAVESIASWSEGGSWIDYKHVGRCNPFVNPFGRFNEAKSKRERGGRFWKIRLGSRLVRESRYVIKRTNIQ